MIFKQLIINIETFENNPILISKYNINTNNNNTNYRPYINILNTNYSKIT